MDRRREWASNHRVLFAVGVGIIVFIFLIVINRLLIHGPIHRAPRTWITTAGLLTWLFTCVVTGLAFGDRAAWWISGRDDEET